MSGKNKIWSSELVAKVIDDIEMGRDTDTSCFWKGNQLYRNSHINFELTKEELKEFAKCSQDVVYFADKYCFAMTDDGIANINLRDYQKDMLTDFQLNRFLVLLSCRQAGKTVTSGIFLAWYLCFHYDRNLLIVANKQSTAIEIVSKIKSVLENLPFFIKPGVENGGELGLRFDNGCRLFSQATTKTAAIGYTIHLLYADEFAHIQDSFLVPFYRSIYPTLSASKISKIIISSTPNGRNLFHQIYTKAVSGENSYTPIRVDWWQVPGRDEQWRENEIANLGSVDLFNQEYGNQFSSGASMLLSSNNAKMLQKISQKYEWKELYEVSINQDDYEHLNWHPNFDPNQNWDKEKDRFLFTIDLADGVGRDYTVMNIFKVEPMSTAKIRKTSGNAEETDFFRIVQCGKFHSNSKSIEECSNILQTLIFEVFGEELVSVIIESNFKAEYFTEMTSKHPDFYPEIFIHTKHSKSSKANAIGVRINRDNKQLYCREMKSLLDKTRLVVTCEDTLNELLSFGLDDKGKFRGQGSHDDLAMSCVLSVNFFNSPDFYENIEDLIDSVNSKIYSEIYNKINSNDGENLLDNHKWMMDL